ncbi:hypothetical protein DCE93_14065 [Agromyces badenianii]|uniref:Uncharacterized protein n=1 Tax=Agromyces badenianii TaxID=2080742 RepID=A0A2S0WZC8_9MICO|nr:NPCBM/NEW2 domain-containing protein [Agromyces badenianii]AWB96632.1 hypothetical protein DCE93_14065 [Agromyces badenianii]
MRTTPHLRFRRRRPTAGIAIALLASLAVATVTAPAANAVEPSPEPTVQPAAPTTEPTTPPATGTPAPEAPASKSPAPEAPTSTGDDVTETPEPATLQAAAAGPLVVNGGFESGTEGWQFGAGTGIATNNPKSGTRLAFVNAGAANTLSQRVTVAQTGTYTGEAWVASQRTGGVFGLRTVGGEVLASVPLPQQTAYRLYTLAPVGLDAGDVVEVFFTGGTGWTNLDDVALPLDTRSLFGFDLSGQQGPAKIDQTAKTVTLQVPFETDVSALTGAAGIPRGATISPDPAAVQNYTQPVAFTVTEASGTETEWTVTVTEEAETVTIASSSQELVDAVNWAKWRARLHVQTGKSGPVNVNGGTPGPKIVDYLPSYWAGYAHRTAFYSRDFVHQAAGGHLLGLEAENKSMLKAFAGTANQSRKWYPLWALNFDGSPYTIDYKSDTNFVREVPAVFELVQEADDQYRWTGDADYLNDPVLWQYYTKAVTDFVALHDTQIPNGVAEGTGRGIFQGAASYNERSDHAVIEAGDGLASQYRGYVAYADLAEAKGDTATAEAFRAKAEELQQFFTEDWGITRDAWEFVRGRGPSNEPYAGFGRENSVFFALKEILDPDDKRTWDYIDYLDRMYKEDRPPNIEATTYVPDALFNYGHDEQAWAWMKDIISKLHLPHEVRTQGVNGDYPELSYTLVSQTVEGLAGVRPNAPEHAVSVRSHLPSEIGWLDLDHIQVGDHDFGVRHDGTSKTVVNHNSGSQPLTVTVEFPGGWTKLKVDGKPMKPTYTHVNGQAVSVVTVTVPVGGSITVAPSGGDNKLDDTIVTHPGDFTLLSPTADATGVDADGAELTWNASPKATSYRVTVARDAAMTDLVAELTTKHTRAIVDELEPGHTYFWEVAAINDRTGQRLVVPAGEWRFRTMPAAVPPAPSAVNAYRNGDVVGVTWTTSTRALTATLYRAPAGTEDFTVLATDLTGTSYLDREASGGTYRYRLTSSNELGEGPGTNAEEQPAPADGPVAHLSDRPWVSASSGWRTVLKDLAVSGNPLRINGTTYAKGLGTHANSEIVYDLEPADAKFHAVVGIDDAQRTSPNASVVFQVIADGEVVFDSGLMRAQPYSPPKVIDLDVLGVQRLVLKVTDAGNTNNSDHADWADAKVVRLPGS